MAGRIRRARGPAHHPSVTYNERGQNTHSNGEWVKIPLLPNNVGKKSVNDSGPNEWSQQNTLIKKPCRAPNNYSGAPEFKEVTF